jgi:RHS repeat-associated protein
VSERYLADPNALAQYWARVGATGQADWMVTDLLGSVRALVSAAGVVEDQITYDAYGNVVSETNPLAGGRLKYAGGQYDGGLGLTLFGARWYNSAAGRWLSQDPLGLGPDSNPYRYVYNSPTNGTDPSGKEPFSWAGWDWVYENENLFIYTDPYGWIRVIPRPFVPLGRIATRTGPFPGSLWVYDFDERKWYLSLPRNQWPPPPPLVTLGRPRVADSSPSTPTPLLPHMQSVHMDDPDLGSVFRNPAPASRSAAPPLVRIDIAIGRAETGPHPPVIRLPSWYPGSLRPTARIGIEILRGPPPVPGQPRTSVLGLHIGPLLPQRKPGSR